MTNHYTSIEQAHIDSEEHARRCDDENCDDCNPAVEAGDMLDKYPASDFRIVEVEA